MATAMLAVPAVAQVAPSIVTDGNLESVIEAHIVGGDTFPQTNLENVTANGSITATTTNDGDATGTFQNNENVAEAEAFGNRDGVTASQATIGSSVLPDDGIALSSASLNDDAGVPNTGAITSNADNSDIGFTGTDFLSGSVDVSGNSVTATTVVNLGSGDFEMAINGSEPVGYTNLATTNAVVTSDLSGNATNVADLEGTLLISSVQESVAGEDSQASAEFNEITVDIVRTGIGTEQVNGTVTLDDNTVASNFTGNDRTASIAIAADDANSAVTAAISNAQLMDANDIDVSAYTGQNNIGALIFTNPVVDETTAFVDSSLSVSGNDIAASATGNRAATDISLADGLAYDTAAGNNATAVIDEYNFDPANKIADVQVNAGLVGSNTQLVINGFIEAQASNNFIESEVQSLESSSIDMTGNRMLAAATGNSVDSGISSGESSALFDASAALASRQEMSNALVQAQSLDNDIQATFGYVNNGTFVDSQVTLDQNVTAANATGNRSRQDISLSATDLALGAGEDGTYFEGDLLAGEDDESVYADGAVVIANAQFNTAASVVANNYDSDLQIDAGDNLNENATNTSTAITNGVQQAFATGSDAGNSISLSGVTVGTGAGISNLQQSDGLSNVTANLGAEAETYYDRDLNNGSALIAGNEQSAVAKGVIASNTLTVDAQTVTSFSIGEDSAGARFDSEVNFVDTAYAVANTQKIQGDVTAEAFGDNDQNYDIDVFGAVRDSTVELVDNTVLAQAQGAVSSNAITLDIGSLNSFFGEDDAAVSNLQIVDGSDILANATGNDEYVTRVTIGDGGTAIGTSDVANSRNAVVASADGARSTNSLTADLTEVNTAGFAGTGFADAYPTDPYNNVDAMFGVVNSQLGRLGSVTSTLRGDTNDGDFFDSAAIYTQADGLVSDSSVASDGNLLQALAAGNRAANTLDVSAVTSVDMNSALANGQVSGQDVSALIGYAGTAGVDPFTVDGTVTTGVWNGNISSLTVDQTTAFLATYSAQPSFSYDSETGAVSFGSVGDGFLQLSVGGSDGTRVAGGVLIEVFDDILASSLTVDGNQVQGSAIGNSATNTVSVDVTSLDGNAGFARAESWINQTGSPEAEASADTTLASSQVVDSNSSSTTDIVSLYGIDAQTTNAVTDSMLSVSNNTQFGEAIGNNVANSLSVAGTDLTNDATSGALSNSQDGDATVSSNSEMEVLANAVSSASNILFEGNSNTSLAVVNNATNVLEASSTNSASSLQANGSSWVDDGGTANASASFVLVNAQSAGGTLNSTATTNIYNVERLDVDTTGVSSGSVSQSSNSTRAEATSNRASNTMTLAAGANLGSTGALVNQQYSSTATSADAVSNITLAVTDSLGNEAVDSSSLAIEGNSTLALARGNSVSNTLNYAAGATYTAATGSALVDPADVRGDAALLNDQVNTGAISATATGSTSIALNGLDGSAGGSVLNSSVSNSNNSVAAYAYGNSASNTVMLSALNTGMPNVAVGNQQLNTGTVNATATSVSFTMSSVGTVSGASMQNNGNVASAIAVGNSSVTVIGAE